MRTSGMIEYITPRQMATESSTTPKSVMKTMVCGYFSVCAAASAGGTSISTSSKNTNLATRSFAPRDEVPARAGLSWIVVIMV